MMSCFPCFSRSVLKDLPFIIRMIIFKVCKSYQARLYTSLHLFYYRVPTQSGKREKVGHFVKPVPGPEKVLIFVISMKNREKPGKSTKRFGYETRI